MDDTREPLGGLIERMTSRIVNSLVIAAGLIALGIYASGPGDIEAPDYQIVASSDGRVVRLNTDTGSIVSCDATRCTLILMRSDDLERVSDDEREKGQARQPALPPPAAAPQNGAAPAAPATPQPTQAAPAPAPAQPQR
ncbi:MAG TPA: hypothetical protein VEW25_00875 [Allosphingosinicella sp.]|nr:hypothetical protein [Allosphingosinicella sp.]